MINLISVDPVRVMKHISEQDYLNHCGLFRSPRNTSYISDAVKLGVRWASDNGCFTDFNETRIRSFLTRVDPEGCLFFNAPDMLLDAVGTLRMWSTWAGIIKKYGFPAAFTVQNDMHKYAIPWDEIDAIFIGSSDDYRLNSHQSYIRDVIVNAIALGKWVHVGRVGGARKIRYWRESGAKSFDSTGFTICPAKVKYLLPYHVNEIQLSFWREIS